MAKTKLTKEEKNQKKIEKQKKIAQKEREHERKEKELFGNFTVQVNSSKTTTSKFSSDLSLKEIAKHIAGNIAHRISAGGGSKGMIETLRNITIVASDEETKNDIKEQLFSYLLKSFDDAIKKELHERKKSLREIKKTTDEVKLLERIKNFNGESSKDVEEARVRAVKIRNSQRNEDNILHLKKMGCKIYDVGKKVKIPGLDKIKKNAAEIASFIREEAGIKEMEEKTDTSNEDGGIRALFRNLTVLNDLIDLLRNLFRKIFFKSSEQVVATAEDNVQLLTRGIGKYLLESAHSTKMQVNIVRFFRTLVECDGFLPREKLLLSKLASFFEERKIAAVDFEQTPEKEISLAFKDAQGNEVKLSSARLDQGETLSNSTKNVEQKSPRANVDVELKDVRLQDRGIVDVLKRNQFSNAVSSFFKSENSKINSLESEDSLKKAIFTML